MPNNNKSRREFFQKTVAASVGLSLGTLGLKSENGFDLSPIAPVKEEWRNKQSGMSYRSLGRTGMMVSEIVTGTFPFNDKKYFSILDAGIERGINYLDAAYAYSKGEVENVVGAYLKESGNREKVFLSTKLSAFYHYIDGVIHEILKGLSEGKRDDLRKKVQVMLEERGVVKSGYHMTYFKGQARQFNETYMRYLVLQEYGYKKEWKTKIKEHAHKLMHGSLKRLQTDYVDVLHCPHGIAMPEMMDDHVLQEVFTEFKQKGYIRASAVSFHNDVTANLAKATEVGYIDVAMFAYNIANHAALESTMFKAKQSGMGLIAMKVAKLFSLNNQPEWRLGKLNASLPNEDLSKFAKAYLWALQNPNLSCCVSQMETVEKIADNCQVVGRKVDILSV